VSGFPSFDEDSAVLAPSTAPRRGTPFTARAVKRTNAMLFAGPPPSSSGRRDSCRSLYWRSWCNLPLDLRRGRAARVVPPGARGTGAMGRSRQVGPVR
jgi:hypothetical protein